MCGGPLEYISYEFVPASPAVSCMSGSSNLNSFRDRGQVAVQLVSCGVLPPGSTYYLILLICCKSVAIVFSGQIVLML